MAFLAIVIFLIVITPMSIIKIETMGYDGIFSHVIAGANVAVRDSITTEPETQKFFLDMGIWNFLKLFVWTTFPTYIIFFPLGAFVFFKNKNRENIELIFLGIPFIAIPYPFSKDDHQYHNAIYCEKKGYCWLLNQKEFTSNSLKEMLIKILDNNDEINLKKENMLKNGNDIENAFLKIERELENLI